MIDSKNRLPILYRIAEPVAFRIDGKCISFASDKLDSPFG